MKTARRDKIFQVAMITCFFGFFLGVGSFAISNFLGGSALFGKKEAGHYFLSCGSKTKSKYVEVSPLTFSFCEVLDWSFLVCIPGVLISGSLAHHFGKTKAPNQ